MAPRETENNAYAKFWGDKKGALWYVMVFSGVVNLTIKKESLTRAYYEAGGMKQQTWKRNLYC